MNYWHSKDGREQAISQIDLEHLLNIVHDTNFRVAKMRLRGVKALGGLENKNVNADTKAAFMNVHPGDVFPAWKSIVKHTKRRFHAQFDFTLFEVRNVVYDAWLNGVLPHPRWSDAIRFCLSADRKALSVPPRMMQYLVTFDVTDPMEFARMCWNLRIDQPMARDMFLRSSLPHQLKGKWPTTVSNSALRFQPVPTARDFPSLGMIDNGNLFQ